MPVTAWILAGLLALGLATPVQAHHPDPLGLPVSQAFDQIESDGRSSPGAQLRLLTQWPHAESLRPEERIEWWVLQGQFQFQLLGPNGAARAIEPITARLDAWPADPYLPLASAAANYLRALQINPKGSPQDVLMAIDQAIDHLPEHARPRTRIRLLAHRAQLLMSDAKWTAAQKTLDEAISLADSQEPGWRSVHLRLMAAQLALSRGSPVDAAAQAQAALDLADKHHDPMGKGRALHQLGLYAASSGQTSMARDQLIQSIRTALDAHSPADAALMQSDLSSVYLDLGQINLAVSTGRQALPVLRAEGRVQDILTLFNRLLRAHLKAGQTFEAQAIAAEAIRLAQTNQDLHAQSETYRILGEGLRELGDLKGAVSALHQYRSSFNSHMQEVARKVRQEAQEQFSAERRHRDLEILSTDARISSAEQRLELLRQDVQRLTLYALVLSLLTGGALIWRSRRKTLALRRSQGQLQLLQGIDPVTGMVKRHLAQNLLEERWRQRGPHGVIIHIALSGLRGYESRHGAEAAQEAMGEWSRRLAASLRDKDHAARWSSDTLMVSSPSEGPEGAKLMAGRLLQLTAPAESLDPGELGPLHMGWAQFPLPSVKFDLSWKDAILLVANALRLAQRRTSTFAVGVSDVSADRPEKWSKTIEQLEHGEMNDTVRITRLGLGSGE